MDIFCTAFLLACASYFVNAAVKSMANMKFFGTRVGLSAAGYSLMRAHFEIFTIYIFYYIFQLPIGCYKKKKRREI